MFTQEEYEMFGAIRFEINFDTGYLTDNKGFKSHLCRENMSYLHCLLEPFPGNIYTIIMDNEKYVTKDWQEANSWLQLAKCL